MALGGQIAIYAFVRLLSVQYSSLERRGGVLLGMSKIYSAIAT